MTCILSLDIDQTIIDFDAMLKRTLLVISDQFLKDFEIHVSEHQLQLERHKILQEYRSTSIDMLDIRKLSFERILSQHNVPKRFAGGLIENFAAERFSNVCFMPGAFDFLCKVSERHSIVAITNGNSDPRRLGFGEFFEHVVLGEKFPFKKPDKRIFSEALFLMKVHDPSSVVHVGDSLENDVLGANESGMVSIWYNPLEVDNDTENCPRFEAQNFEEIQTILKDVE